MRARKENEGFPEYKEAMRLEAKTKNQPTMLYDSRTKKKPFTLINGPLGQVRVTNSTKRKMKRV